MALTGKLEAEVEVHSSAAKLFSFFVTELHQLENASDVVHGSKVLQGDWHGVGSHSVKQWTYTLDGKVETCKEHFEEIHHANKSLKVNFFDGEVGEKYKSLKAKLKVVDKSEGSLAKWTYEYEKAHEGIPPPQAYLDLATKYTKDVDAHLLKAT